ncbi:hypothetical protein [Pedobacter sandarakinus]|uniref:hypothetical protein n=1 Tax=Pedobacter sandarakinus TaxID=353156 RepID=UPI0022454D00|nr:hypothetical protein [Pedobacter sandarakinus]MCX2575738.1 hypothetical protein [Pedobacter sandarakinus]
MKKTTVFSELRNEFSDLIEHLLASISGFFKKYPKVIFSSMVLLLASSFLLCFTLLRMESKAPIEKKALLKVEGGLSEIGTTLSKLKRTLEIREALKVLLTKETLNSQDSLLMVSMVAELERAGQTKN